MILAPSTKRKVWVGVTNFAFFYVWLPPGRDVPELGSVNYVHAAVLAAGIIAELLEWNVAAFINTIYYLGFAVYFFITWFPDAQDIHTFAAIILIALPYAIIGVTDLLLYNILSASQLRRLWPQTKGNAK